MCSSSYRCLSRCRDRAWRSQYRDTCVLLLLAHRVVFVRDIEFWCDARQDSCYILRVVVRMCLFQYHYLDSLYCFLLIIDIELPTLYLIDQCSVYKAWFLTKAFLVVYRRHRDRDEVILECSLFCNQKECWDLTWIEWWIVEITVCDMRRICCCSVVINVNEICAVILSMWKKRIEHYHLSATTHCIVTNIVHDSQSLKSITKFWEMEFKCLMTVLFSLLQLLEI